MRRPVPSDEFRCYRDLARRYSEGVDYAVHVIPRGQSRVAVLAPHGGRIEGGTSEIARLIAGEEHALYLFEGLRTSGDNFDCLHLASHCFDEPRGLDLISSCDTVISVHGYVAPGPDVLLGGLNERLKTQVAQALAAIGLSFATEGHRFPGRDPRNVCNRGRSGAGVQLELSDRLRKSRDWSGIAGAVRSVLPQPARAPGP
ncbi:MAG TPA: poly-gamma-glutamate hydrolase family protein [Steroidobacteraceae bacterium]|nr:poly-gamma-glutamate hydrolase family protein [Steroidobacteraceae bacterium]